MKVVTFGSQALSRIGLGTWMLGEAAKKHDQELEALQYGLSHGINVIDTAEMYGHGNSERLVGEAIQPFNRQKLFLISKFYPYHAKPEQERHSLMASLKRLGTDYLDLYLLHWRGAERLSTTVKGLEDLKKEGLIRHWGVSNFDLSDLKELVDVPGGEACFANEDLYNLTSRGVEYELLAWQRAHQIGFMAYSPFNSGEGNTIRVTNHLKRIARRHGVSVHQLMLAWTMRSGQVLSLPRSSNVRHVKENIEATEIQFSDDDLKLLDADFEPPTHHVNLEMI